MCMYTYLHNKNHAAFLYIKWIIAQVVFTNEICCIDLRKDKLILFSLVNMIILNFL